MEKQRWEESEKRRAEERRSEKRKRKGSKVAKHSVFPVVCGSRGSKSRLAKAAGAEPSGEMTDEKLRAVVARSTFGSQNAKNTSCSEHLWKFRCRKSARRCSAKHFFKSKRMLPKELGAGPCHVSLFCGSRLSVGWCGTWSIHEAPFHHNSSVSAASVQGW